MAPRTAWRLIAAGVLLGLGTAAWLANRRPTIEPGADAQRWTPGTRVRWVDESLGWPCEGEWVEVRAGDEGVVVLDDSPTEFCVSFPATGPFCTSRSWVERLHERH